MTTRSTATRLGTTMKNMKKNDNKVNSNMTRNNNNMKNNDNKVNSNKTRNNNE